MFKTKGILKTQASLRGLRREMGNAEKISQIIFDE